MSLWRFCQNFQMVFFHLDAVLNLYHEASIVRLADRAKLFIFLYFTPSLRFFFVFILN